MLNWDENPSQSALRLQRGLEGTMHCNAVVPKRNPSRVTITVARKPRPLAHPSMLALMRIIRKPRGEGVCALYVDMDWKTFVVPSVAHCTDDLVPRHGCIVI